MATLNLALFQNEPAPKIVPSGSTLFCAGEPGYYLYVLLKGEAEIMVDDVVVETAKPGSVIGEMALLDSQPRSATVFCPQECSFAQIDRPRFEFLVRQNPTFALDVMKIMSERLRSTNKRL